MAITKIHPIKNTVQLAVNYVCDPEKTDEKQYVSTYGCNTETAEKEFEITRDFANMKPREGEAKAQHLIQSFSVGEVTPKTAHEVGKKLAESLLKGQYEYVISTHIDKGHVHNHIIFNSVNMETKNRYHSTPKSYYEIRKINDNLCKEYGLSVIEKPSKNKGKTNNEIHSKGNENKSWYVQKQELKKAIDTSIKGTKTFDEFIEKMKEKGYTEKRSKRGGQLAFLGSSQKKNIRTSGIGEQYSEEKIKLKIDDNSKLNIHEQAKDPNKKYTKYQYRANENTLKNVKFSTVRNGDISQKTTRYTRQKNASESINTYNFLSKKNIHSKEQLNEEIHKTQEKIISSKENISVLQTRITEINLIKNTVNKYHTTKKEYEKSPNKNTEKAFQNIRNNLKEMQFKKLPDIEVLNIELSEIKNGIEVFEKHINDTVKEYKNLQTAKENLYGKETTEERKSEQIER